MTKIHEIDLLFNIRYTARRALQLHFDAIIWKLFCDVQGHSCFKVHVFTLFGCYGV